MEKKVAIYRESFNPPGRRHRLVAEALCKQFDEVIVAPWHRLPKLLANSTAICELVVQAL